MNIFNIQRSFKTKKERGWDTLWWFIDLHDTICKGTYKTKGKRVFFKHAKEVLQFLTNRKDIILVLFTCSHNDDITDVLKWLCKDDIHFNYVNENPDIKNNKLSNFTQKPYFNVVLDDKAGFEGETDWLLVKQELEKEYSVEI